MSNDVIFSKTTFFFYISRSSTSKGVEDEWSIYQVTHVLQSDDVIFPSPSYSIEHHIIVVPSTHVPANPQLHKSIRGDGRPMIHL